MVQAAAFAVGESFNSGEPGLWAGGGHGAKAAAGMPMPGYKRAGVSWTRASGRTGRQTREERVEDMRRRCEPKRLWSSTKVDRSTRGRVVYMAGTSTMAEKS